MGVSTNYYNIIVLAEFLVGKGNWHTQHPGYNFNKYFTKLMVGRMPALHLPLSSDISINFTSNKTTSSWEWFILVATADKIDETDN